MVSVKPGPKKSWNQGPGRAQESLGRALCRGAELLRAQGLGFMVSGLGFRIYGLGFRA